MAEKLRDSIADFIDLISTPAFICSVSSVIIIIVYVAAIVAIRNKKS